MSAFDFLFCFVLVWSTTADMYCSFYCTELNSIGTGCMDRSSCLMVRASGRIGTRDAGQPEVATCLVIKLVTRMNGLTRFPLSLSTI